MNNYILILIHLFVYNLVHSIKIDENNKISNEYVFTNKLGNNSNSSNNFIPIHSVLNNLSNDLPAQSFLQNENQGYNSKNTKNVGAGFSSKLNPRNVLKIFDKNYWFQNSSNASDAPYNQYDDVMENQQNNDSEYKESSDEYQGEPIDTNSGEPIDTNIGEPIDTNSGEPIDTNSGELIDTNSGEPIDTNSGEPIDTNSGEPIDTNSGEPIDTNSGEPIDTNSGEPIDTNSGEPIDESNVPDNKKDKEEKKDESWDFLKNPKGGIFDIKFDSEGNVINPETENKTIPQSIPLKKDPWEYTERPIYESFQNSLKKDKGFQELLSDNDEGEGFNDSDSINDKTETYSNKKNPPNETNKSMDENLNQEAIKIDKTQNEIPDVFSPSEDPWDYLNYPMVDTYQSILQKEKNNQQPFNKDHKKRDKIIKRKKYLNNIIKNDYNFQFLGYPIIDNYEAFLVEKGVPDNLINIASEYDNDSDTSSNDDIFAKQNKPLILDKSLPDIFSSDGDPWIFLDNQVYDSYQAFLHKKVMYESMNHRKINPELYKSYNILKNKVFLFGKQFEIIKEKDLVERENSNTRFKGLGKPRLCKRILNKLNIFKKNKKLGKNESNKLLNNISYINMNFINKNNVMYDLGIPEEYDSSHNATELHSCPDKLSLFTENVKEDQLINIILNDMELYNKIKEEFNSFLGDNDLYKVHMKNSITNKGAMVGTFGRFNISLHVIKNDLIKFRPGLEYIQLADEYTMSDYNIINFSNINFCLLNPVKLSKFLKKKEVIKMIKDANLKYNDIYARYMEKSILCYYIYLLNIATLSSSVKFDPDAKVDGDFSKKYNAIVDKGLDKKSINILKSKLDRKSKGIANKVYKIVKSNRNFYVSNRVAISQKYRKSIISFLAYSAFLGIIKKFKKNNNLLAAFSEINYAISKYVNYYNACLKDLYIYTLVISKIHSMLKMFLTFISRNGLLTRYHFMVLLNKNKSAFKENDEALKYYNPTVKSYASHMTQYTSMVQLINDFFEGKKESISEITTEMKESLEKNDSNLLLGSINQKLRDKNMNKIINNYKKIYEKFMKEVGTDYNKLIEHRFKGLVNRDYILYDKLY